MNNFVTCPLKQYLPGPTSLSGHNAKLIAEMNNLANHMLLLTSPKSLEKTWNTIYQFDTQRFAGQVQGNDVLQNLKLILENEEHPRYHDAELLSDIVNRPIDEKSPSLERYLYIKVYDMVDRSNVEDLTDPSSDQSNLPNPCSRTFNSILPDIAISTQNYHSIGRTLMFKGAAHGLANTPTHLSRQQSLERCIFFQSERTPLTYQDFCNQSNDPFEEFYEK